MSRNSNMPPIIVRGESFTIYGEIHNDINNEFYESLSESFNDSTDRILVEHSSHKPFLESDKVSLSIVSDKTAFLTNFKGSEWIYISRLIRDKPVEPIDIRVENGFPTAYQEIGLIEFAKEEPLVFLEIIIDQLKVISSHEESYKKPGIEDMFHSIYDALKKHIETFVAYLDKKEIDEESIHKICTNLKYLSVLFFDSNLLEIILENNRKRKHKKNLVIFVGARHAINLYLFLEENGMKGLQIHKTARGETIQPIGAIQ